MNLKCIIIFLFFLLEATFFATQAHGTKSLPNKLDGSSLNYNLALNHLEAGKLGLAKAHIERSLFINPLRNDSAALKSSINEQIAKSINLPLKESISFPARLFNKIPPVVSYILLITAVFLLSLSFAKLHFKEKSTFKEDPQLKAKALGSLFLLFLATSLYISKEIYSAQTWACVVSDSAPLYTGPDENDFTQTASIPLGNCMTVTNISAGWVALTPQKYRSGWTKRSDILLINRYKIDPSTN